MEHPFLARPTLRDIAEHLGVSTATVSLAMRGNERNLRRYAAKGGRSARRARIRLPQERREPAHFDDPHGGRNRQRRIRSVFRHPAGCAARGPRAGRPVGIPVPHQGVRLAPGGFSAHDVGVQRRRHHRLPGNRFHGAGFQRGTGSDFRPSCLFREPYSSFGFDHVINDDGEAAQLAVDRLVSLGHRRIAFVGGESGRKLLPAAARRIPGSSGAGTHPVRRGACPGLASQPHGGVRGGALGCRTGAAADGCHLLQRSGRAGAVLGTSTGRPVPRQELRAHRP